MNSPKPALVTQRGARRLPRIPLLLLCAAYVLPGVFGRDPWRNADLSAFGLMLGMAEGRTPWLAPTLGGWPAETALLPHWLGAWAIQALPFLEPALAARLPFAALRDGETVLADSSIDGRATADHASVLSSGFNRPEDLEIQTVGGVQRLYFTTTDAGSFNSGSSRVYNLNLATGEVQLFVDTNTIDLATGQKVGAGLKNADNLAIDADGNLYIIEDRNGGVDNDIWFARDLNKDGDLLDAGEGIGRWASNGTQGSEMTGLFFSLTDPNKAYVNIQHPSSGNDSLIEITAVPEPGTYAMLLAGLGVVGAIARRRKA